jgi:hypothetical protein
MKGAVEMYPEEVNKIPCAAHRIHLSATDIIKEKKIKYKKGKYYIMKYNEDGALRKTEITLAEVDEIEKTNEIKERINSLIAKCRHLVGSFNSSEKLTRSLKKQGEYKIKIKKLVQDVATRWNTMLDMSESIVINEKALRAILLDIDSSKIHDYIPSPQEFEVLKEFVKLLKPLKDATVLLSGSNYVTIGILYPIVANMILYTYANTRFTNNDIKTIHKELMKSLEIRLKYVMGSLFAAATALNHNYKKFEFLKVK